MGKPLLLLRLEGPLQSWGLRSRWDVRDSGEEPSKSGIIGLLGAALGYPMGDARLETLEEALRLGIRVESPGLHLTDFQTISGRLRTAEGGMKGSQEDPATIISPREYLQDAAFLAVLDGAADLLQACAQALQQPRWPIYLGRKSCPPIRPVFEGLTEAYTDIADALQRHPWDWEGRVSLGSADWPQTLQYFLEDPDGTALRPDRIRVNPARMYASRAVHVCPTPFPGAVEREPAGISRGDA